MVKFNGKKAISVLLLTCLTVGIAGCSNTDTSKNDTANSETQKETTQGTESSEGPTKEDNGYTNITILSGGSGIFEEEKSAVIKEIADKTGVFAQGISVPEEKISVLMASGDLDADIILPSSNSAMNMDRLVEGELVLPLNDLLEKNGQDIKKNIPDTLEFYRKYRSNGKDEVFFLSSHNTPDVEALKASKQYSFPVAPYIRWDYYKELGSPAINSEDDLLNVLKQMQDNHPTTENGKKTYAMTLNLDAALWSYHTMYSYMNDRESVGGYYVSRDSNGEIKENILQDDHITWRAAAYYNKAHRLGIFDPESFTQKGENVSEKCKSGQAFYTENSWNNYNTVLAETVGPEAGFEPVLSGFPTVYAANYSNYGWGFTTGISASSKNPEATMTWLNYLYTPEGARTIYSGVEGVHWEYDANKVPTLKEETLKMINDEEWNKTAGIKKYANWVGIDNSVIHPDGYPLDLFNMPEVMVDRNLAIDNAYCEENGVTVPYEVGLKMQDEGKIKVVWWNGDEGLLMAPMPDDIKKIYTKVDDALIKGMPRLIMANSEEEFNKIKADIMKQIESMGVQTAVDWVITEYTAAQEKLKSLQ